MQLGNSSRRFCLQRYQVAGRATTDLGAVINAIFYLLRTGCQWRLLPREFPAWGIDLGFEMSSFEQRRTAPLHPGASLSELSNSVCNTAKAVML
jgi:hypothetical protein